MKYRCNAAPNAVPCIRTSTHDDTGKLLDKPKRHYKAVKNGAILYAVPDRCSRKHFTPVDADAKAQNKEDYTAMLAECKKLGIKVPPNTPFSVLADSLAKIEYDGKMKQKAKRPALLTVETTPKKVELVPAPVAPIVDNAKNNELTEAKALRKAIRAKGGKCTNFDKLPKLKKINATLEGR